MYMIHLFKCVKKGKNPVLELLPISAIVDGNVFDELDQFKWFVNAKGYVRRKVNQSGTTVNYAIHSEVMRINQISQPGPDYTVDHIDGNKLDNRLRNLRWATRVQQLVNTVCKSSGLPRGVTRRGNRYAAQLTSRSKGIHLHIGTFDTPQEASVAFESKWAEVHPELICFRRN
jgi:hypothetical protein